MDGLPQTVDALIAEAASGHKDILTNSSSVDVSADAAVFCPQINEVFSLFHVKDEPNATALCQITDVHSIEDAHSTLNVTPANTDCDLMRMDIAKEQLSVVESFSESAHVADANTDPLHDLVRKMSTAESGTFTEHTSTDVATNTSLVHSRLVLFYRILFISILYLYFVCFA